MTDSPLHDWALNHAKMMMAGFGGKVTEDGIYILAKSKRKELSYAILDDLNDDIFGFKSPLGTLNVVCHAHEKNLLWLKDHLEKLAENRQLRIIFADTVTHKYVQFIPWSHAMVADVESLEQGLRSTFNEAFSLGEDSKK